MTELQRQLAALIESADTNIHAGNGQSGCGRYTAQILISVLQQAKADHRDNSTLQALTLQKEYMPLWTEVLAIAKFIKASLPLASLN